MPIWIYKWKLYTLLVLFFVSSVARSQSYSLPSSYQGKQYLSPQGWYLHFINNRKALFNTDTVEYNINRDTLHLISIHTWIGEQIHQLRKNYFYLLSPSPNGLRLQPLSLPGSSVPKDTIIFTDLSSISSDISQFDHFTITKKEYLTSSGEREAGIPLRTDTVYTITKVGLYENKKLVTEIGHLTITHGPEGTSEKYSRMLKKKIKLSNTAFGQKLDQLRKGYYSFMEDNPCQTNYLHYRFEYNSGKMNHYYTRCWLNALELPVSDWLSIKKE
jgi:hypothetical protein